HEKEGLLRTEREQKAQVQKLADANALLATEKGRLADEERRQRKTVERQFAGEVVNRGLDLCERGLTTEGGLWLARGLELAAAAGATDLARAVRANLAHGLARLHPMRAALRHDKQVAAAAFSPDGRTVLTGSLDGTARLWDAATGRPVGEPLRLGGAVWSVALSPDGKTVATGGGGGVRWGGGPRPAPAGAGGRGPGGRGARLARG